MARIRSLKPGFFTNEHLAELSPWHRLCFAGLWTLADREGRLEDRPRRIKAAIFPYDDLDMDDLLNGLHDAGFVTRYAADGVACLAITNFQRHQRPKEDEHPSALPPVPLDVPRGNSRGRARIKDIGTEDIGTERGTRADAARPADGADLFGEPADGAAQRRAEDLAELWNAETKPPIPRCRELSSKRRRQVRARLTERDWDTWRAVFQRIQASRFCRGENTRGWRATFDWVIGSPDVAVKVLEGKYDDGQPTARERPFTPAEVAEAKAIRRRKFGCPHEERCPTESECISLIVRYFREQRVESA